MHTSSPFEATLRVPVDPHLERQLDPRGIALLWRRRGIVRGGLLAVVTVCDDPDCESRDVQVWAIPVTDDLVAVEMDGTGRVGLLSAPRPDRHEEPPSGRDPELYALIDTDDWSVHAHPAYTLDARAHCLLVELRAQMDDELRAYLLDTFETARRHVKRESARLRRGRRRGGVPNGLTH